MNIGSTVWSILGKNGVSVNMNNNIEMNPTSTRYLAADYINYRLRKHGHTWRNAPPLQGETNKIHRAMRTLADEFEERYQAEFSDMVRQLNINPDIAYPTFIAVAKELFIDGINWGRIVALFAFAGAIAIECVEKDMEHLVDSIYDWISQYVQSNLDDWIKSQGDWAGLAEFYEKSPHTKDRSLWPSLGKMCLGAVGVLALGALLTQKS